MEDKKIIYLIIVVILILLSAVGVGVILYYRLSSTPPPVPIVNNTHGEPNDILPHLTGTSTPDIITTDQTQQLEKEKQFISSFYRTIPVNYDLASPNYSLPIKSVKDEIDNYRDFSRKVGLDNALNKLAEHGFVVIADPFKTGAADWESSYKIIAQANVPMVVTADSALGLYISTLQAIYKEIEQEEFYPSLWEVLSQLAKNAKVRYDYRRQQIGIENNLLAEADRLELAYALVALKLLAPEPSQIRTSLAADSPFFSAEDAKRYTVLVPDYLEDQITKELKLIDTRPKSAESPILLYAKGYDRYAVPKNYQSSEKLKNYYLAITWLNDALFPLWPQSAGCPTCLLDQEDQRINFVASLALATDLASTQELQNRWANIYKSISFFKGLEANLTYLDYARAVKTVFGDMATLETIFTADRETVNNNIAKLQRELAAVKFLSILSDTPDTGDHQGLRLLRNQYNIEQRVLPGLTGEKIGEYQNSITPAAPGPFTACQQNKKYLRCAPTALDLFWIIGNTTAESIINDTGNSSFTNYQATRRGLSADIEKFTDNTWHDNMYLNVLFAQTMLDREKTSGWPAFMTTDAWRTHSLTSGLGAWADLHRDLTLDRTLQPDTTGLTSYFPYGYVQPEPQLYHELLASTEMVLDGFTALQIISPNSKSFDRLNNLKIVLETLAEITKLELQNQPLSSVHYAFINNFSKQIRGAIGDIKKDGLALRTQFTITGNGKLNVTEQLDGLDYLVAVYPGADGKKFLAIGPVYRYSEKNSAGKTFTAWQNIFKP